MKRTRRQGEIYHTFQIASDSGLHDIVYVEQQGLIVPVEARLDDERQTSTPNLPKFDLLKRATNSTLKTSKANDTDTADLAKLSSAVSFAAAAARTGSPSSSRVVLVSNGPSPLAVVPTLGMAV